MAAFKIATLLGKVTPPPPGTVLGGEPAEGAPYPPATLTPPAGAPAGYPAPNAGDPLDPWLPLPRSGQRYGGLFSNCNWQGKLYDCCSKTAHQAHSSGANVKWNWLNWRRSQVGQGNLSDKERAFFDADAGRAVAGSFVEKAATKIDPTSSSSIFGPKVASALKPVVKPIDQYVIKPAIATGAAMVTGGASVLAGQAAGGGAKDTFGVKPTAIGFAEGAAVGTAIAIAGPAAVTAAGSKAATAVAVGTATSLIRPDATRPAVTSTPAAAPVASVAGPSAAPSFLDKLIAFAFPSK